MCHYRVSADAKMRVVGNVGCMKTRIVKKHKLKKAQVAKKNEQIYEKRTGETWEKRFKLKA